MTKTSSENPIVWRSGWLLLGLALAFISVPWVAQADEPTWVERFEEAKSNLLAGKPDRTAQIIEELTRDEGYSPELLRLLAEARLAQEQVGQAIFALEQAKLLDPQSNVLDEKLASIRKEHGLDAPESSSLEHVAKALPARRWMQLGGMGIVLFVLGAFGSSLFLRRRKMLVGLSLTGAIIASVSAGALWIGTYGLDEVVVTADAEALVSPNEHATAVFELRDGQVVEALDEHGEYVLLARPDGGSGWVRQAYVRSIHPGKIR